MPPTPRPPLERALAKVEVGDCWLWTASVGRDGYGQFFPAAGVRVGAHRFIYEALVGPVPTGLELDHLCRVRRCVNPDHLEPVTRRENIIRGTSPAARHARRTHCSRGHRYTKANTYRHRKPSGTYSRECRTCVLAAQNAANARKRAAI